MSDHRRAQSPVRNQDDRPTCVAFAVSAAHEWMADEQTHRSVEDALWAGHQVLHIPGRQETSVAAALEGLSRHGHASETAWPYGSPPYPAERPALAADPTAQRPLPPWQALPKVDVESLAAELERSVAVLLTVRVVRSAWRKPDGIIDVEPPAKVLTNHAVLAVGVQESPVRVIVKNSWGPRWGQAGYGFMTERYLTHYGLRAHVLEAAP